MSETELKEFFSRVRKGNKEAFAWVYTELKQPVYTVVRRIVQSKELAEDVTQDVFVKLFVSPPDPSVKNLRAWIFRMARNGAIDALRKKQSTDLDGEEPAPEDEIGRLAMRMDMEAAIGSLPAAEREILSLRINGELGFREISSVTGMSVPAVYRKYRKAINTLRERLSGGAL